MAEFITPQQMPNAPVGNAGDAPIGDAADSAEYPLIHLSRSGTMAVLLKHDIILELLPENSIRIVCPSKFSVFCDGTGKTMGILHQQGKIYKTNNTINCVLDAQQYPRYGDEQRTKQIAFGRKGILFSMSHLKQAMFISSVRRPSERGLTWTRNGDHIGTIPSEQVEFPKLDHDFTLHAFYNNESASRKMRKQAAEAVKKAEYRYENDSLHMAICNAKIKQSPLGEIRVETANYFAKCCPESSVVELRCGATEFYIDNDGKALIKDGCRRAHGSKSGLVVGDGLDLAMVDQNGRIVGC
ncbi:hypothetical protein L596_006963 [Steinernema carpocapsae]|uniref:Uncharacterized protein n=1 Tax=Steinernema carpocapsae TaxID=34508 RepID=A0A4U5P7L4_STECR|nr:hypothetical protein L596_006963 [Steinernema carpocapsae]